MQVDKYGQHIYTPDELFAHYMRNPDQHPRSVVLTHAMRFDPLLELEHAPQVTRHRKTDISIQEYDAQCQNNWHMPEQYKTLDIAQYIIDKCTTNDELERVGSELILYQRYELFPLLRYLVYLVDTMRKHNIVWGVGRGSSVASYVLYLIGVHRINSITYDLDIREFLK